MWSWGNVIDEAYGQDVPVLAARTRSGKAELATRGGRV
jgi:hypothetical protein